MKLTSAIFALCVSNTVAFSPSATFTRRTSALNIGNDPNVYTGGNSWKPKSETSGSTDTGDYFPEDYVPETGFAAGMMGAQQNQGTQQGPELPGMENLGDDAVMMGGIEEASEIPAGMEFIPSSVPDGEFEFQVAGSSKGGVLSLSVKPVCMGFEDYYAGFAPGSHPSLTVGPVAGRMDRRGGEPTELKITCEPKGQAGLFEGNLVINLPEDNSKICYKIVANVF